MRINRSQFQISSSLVAVLLWSIACGSASDMIAEDELPVFELSAAPDTTAGSATAQPSVLTEGSPPTPTLPLTDVVNIWLFQIGLQGPSDLGEWQERLERVCDAPIWEAEAAARIATEFVLEDGGDPTQPEFLQAAVFALWSMARQPIVCGDRFPPDADYPPSVG